MPNLTEHTMISMKARLATQSPNKFPSHSVKSLIAFYSPPENPLDLSLSESVERDIQGLLSQAPIAFYVHPKC